ncbi:hypothetical protein ACFWOY_23370 [Streptomyces sp. NPDC058423]|uniref:hypothetical protein n=1 Tax=unclassified Streptomyces TaxID=2593676 RepID=UPI00364B0A9E
MHSEKRDLFVPYENPGIGAAFSFNTVPSIPYAIDEILPLLTAETREPPHISAMPGKGHTNDV